MSNDKVQQDWVDLKKHIIGVIDDIDRQTEWQEWEPSWWLHMMQVRRLVADEVSFE